ncbi:hypothetical protein A3K70_00215 [Candidatus Bathyarchaeota archaeon RBG_16_48_13]|nr:MAG: hypothetical protein A3K70_00215 [Candidatus Bathyarchaeota archaeon RBG_16_48_13]
MGDSLDEAKDFIKAIEKYGFNDVNYLYLLVELAVLLAASKTCCQTGFPYFDTNSTKQHFLCQTLKLFQNKRSQNLECLFSVMCEIKI